MERTINNNERNRLLSGVVAMGIATVLVKILSVLYKIPMLSILGEEGMGYFNTAYTIYGFFYIVCTAGVPKAIMILLSGAKERGAHREYDNILKSAFILFSAIGCALFIVFLLLAGVIAKCIGSPNSVFSMIVVAPSLIIVSITGVLRGYLSSVGRLGSISVSQILEGVFKLCSGLVLSHYSRAIGIGVPMCGAVAIIGVDLGALAAMLYMFFTYKKDIRGHKAGQKLILTDFKKHSKSIFSISVPITVTSAVMSISSIIDLFMIMSRLGSLGYGEAECARLYGNFTTLSVPMFNLCIALISPLSIAYLPRLASCNVIGDEAKFSSTLSTFSNLTMFLSAFLFGVMRYFPKQALYFVFGDNGYVLGGELLSSLSISIASYSALLVVNTALEAKRCVRAPLISMLIGCIFKIPIEYLLLSDPNINIFGAVYSTNATYIIALLISIMFAVKRGAFQSRDAVFSIGFFLVSLTAASGAQLLYDRLSWSPENRFLTIAVMTLLLILYLILSLFVAFFACLFTNRRQNAQKQALNFM